MTTSATWPHLAGLSIVGHAKLLALPVFPAGGWVSGSGQFFLYGSRALKVCLPHQQFHKQARIRATGYGIRISQGKPSRMSSVIIQTWSVAPP